MSDTGRPDESALIAAARAGDARALETLVRTHARAVYAHALRFFGDPQAAEDVTQEVFIKVVRSIATFQGTAAFSTWLYRITRNVCLDELRSGRRRPVPVDPLDIPAPAAEDIADGVSLSVTLEAAMRALAPEEREALSAISLWGMSYAEAADAIGVPSGTIKSRVFRARRSLVAILDSTPMAGDS